VIAYKVKNLKVTEVECEKIEYPLEDSQGDTIFINTHFATKEEAYNKAICDCDAGIYLTAREIENLRQRTKKRETDLADYVIARNKLKDELVLLSDKGA